MICSVLLRSFDTSAALLLFTHFIHFITAVLECLVQFKTGGKRLGKIEDGSACEKDWCWNSFSWHHPRKSVLHIVKEMSFLLQIRWASRAASQQASVAPQGEIWTAELEIACGWEVRSPSASSCLGKQQSLSPRAARPAEPWCLGQVQKVELLCPVQLSCVFNLLISRFCLTAAGVTVGAVLWLQCYVPS